MKKPGKISIIFTILVVLFTVFSPNLIVQKNTAEAYCVDGACYTGCSVGCIASGAVFCGIAAWFFNLSFPLCVSGGGVGCGGGGINGLCGGGFDLGCTEISFGGNYWVNFDICTAAAAGACLIGCSVPCLENCVCTGSMNGTMCSGDNTGLPNGFWDGNLPWQGGGCTSRKCEWYTPTCTPNCGDTSTRCTTDSWTGNCGQTCTGTKNCSASDGRCGTCAGAYPYETTNYPSGCTQCAVGAHYAMPPFPSPGSSTTWVCLGINGGSTATCTVSRAAAPIINGACGDRNTTYAYTVTGWPTGSTYCTTGTPSASPSFPGLGTSVTWHCDGVNGGTESPTCTATRDANPCLINITAVPTYLSKYYATSTISWNSSYAIGCWGWRNKPTDDPSVSDETFLLGIYGGSVGPGYINSSGSGYTSSLTEDRRYNIECWNSDGDVCSDSAIITVYSCAGSIPTGSTPCSGSDMGLTANGTWHNVSSCGTAKCAYTTCISSCSCVADTCEGSVCYNGCNGTCPGTKNCDNGEWIETSP